jgi:spermidine/putrescine transport system permease protein
MKVNPFGMLTVPYILWMVFIIVLPMLLIILYAFTVPGNDVVTFRFSLENFQRFFTDEIFPSVLLRSLFVAVITTVLCIILGYPIAYIISKLSGRKSVLMILLITFPTWINMLVRTYAWKGMLQTGGLFSTILGYMGFEDVTLLHTHFAVALGMVYNFLPFMIIQIYTSLAKLDTSLLEAAADLGANRTKSFLKVTLPLSIPGVLSGITLVFLPAVSSFYIPEMLGGGRYYMVGNLIETQFLTTENWNFGSAVSLIMVIIIIISMYFTRKADKTEIMEQRGN